MPANISYDDWLKMGQFAQLDDGKVFYVHKGRGFPLLLMHFYGGNSWWVSPIMDALAEHFSVYAIDIPGCSQSEVPPFPYGPPEYADAITEFMNKMGIDRAHLLGIHGSSLTAKHIATTRPSRVAKLILDGYAPWNRLEGRKLYREAVLPTWIDENQAIKPYEEWGGIGNPFPSLQGTERETAMKRVSQDFSKNPMWSASIIKEALKYDCFSRLDMVAAPTLIIYGDSDWGMQPVTKTGGAPIDRLLNGILGSRLEIIPNAGLVPSFEQPEIYAKIVLDFLKTPD